MNARLLLNAVLSRTAWLNRLLDPRRNIDAECGHPMEVSISDFQGAWSRGDIARRIISVYPDETWSQLPEVYETEDPSKTPFEQAWEDLNFSKHLFAHLHRADVLSGIGRFGILLLGFKDSGSMDKPLPGIDEEGQSEGEQEHELIFLRPLEESLVKVKEMETNTGNPRFGQPTLYEITFAADQMPGVTVESGATVTKLVHWTRVLHICDNRTNSEIFGIPRLQQVYNRVLDLRKVAGGSAEMFWKGGFPGLSMESHPQNTEEDPEFDKEATKQQLEDYMNGLQRYISTIGMTVKSLSVQIADPRPHVETQVRLIASAMSVPWRILMGSEEAQLASEQDTRTWNRRLAQRRERYVNPFIIRPFVDRLLAAGALPQPDNKRYQIEWPDLELPSEKDQAVSAEHESNAMAAYVKNGADALIPPFHYLTLVLGYSEKEALTILAAGSKSVKDGGAGSDPEDPSINPVAVDRKKKQETAQAIAAQTQNRPGAAGLPVSGRSNGSRGAGNPANNGN